MATKTLNTRVALRYDSYKNWTTDTEATQAAKTNANLVLLKGEIGLCEVTAADNSPSLVDTVLYKVGNGKDAFKDLPWAYAPAADVHDWAKASEVKLTTTTVEGGVSVKAIEFVGTSKKITLDYLTEAEVKTITEAINANVSGLNDRLTLVEESLGLREDDDGETAGSVAEMLGEFSSKLETITGEGEGSIKKAATDAETSAKSYADGQLASTAAELSAQITANTTSITGLQTSVNNLDANYKAADNVIKKALGVNSDGNLIFNDTATVSQAIEVVRSSVETFGNSQTAKNTELTNAINAVSANLAGEATTRQEEDSKLENRLKKVEAFFGSAKEHDGYTGLDNALDTLKEIQEYLNGPEGTATNGLISRIAGAETDIDNLEKEFDANGRVTKAEGDIDALEGRASVLEGNVTTITSTTATLENIVNGYAGNGSIKTAVDKAQEDATKGINDAAAAQSTANTAAADITTLAGRVSANEGTIAGLNTSVGALQDIVDIGEGKTIKDAVSSLRNLTSDQEKGNEAIYTNLTTLTNSVNHTTTGLAATYSIANTNKNNLASLTGRVAAIEADYLKVADEFIFRCGTASTVTHNASNAE